MAFPEYTINLVYCCFSIVLGIASFIVGTIYTKITDRREEQRREWRQFAERISNDYSKLKDKDIPRKISKVRDAFQEIRMNSTITGLDVLRYMLADANYERCKTPELECLREDLQSIFQMFQRFDVCSSLLPLREMPTNIKEMFTGVFTELGEVALPSFKGKHRETILKYPQFGSKAPKLYRLDDQILRETVPYVKSCLRFGSPDWSEWLQSFDQDGRDYSKCSNFSFHVKECSQGSDAAHLKFLLELEELCNDLKEPKYMEGFARELREHPIKLIFEQFNKNDEDKLLLVKVLHEVGVYIHLYLNKNVALSAEERLLAKHRKQITTNMTRLSVVQEKVNKLMPTEARVKSICGLFIRDLRSLQNSHDHCNNETFASKLEELHETFGVMQRENARHSNPFMVISRTETHV